MFEKEVNASAHCLCIVLPTELNEKALFLCLSTPWALAKKVSSGAWSQLRCRAQCLKLKKYLKKNPATFILPPMKLGRWAEIIKQLSMWFSLSLTSTHTYTHTHMTVRMANMQHPHTNPTVRMADREQATREPLPSENGQCSTLNSMRMADAAH